MNNSLHWLDVVIKFTVKSTRIVTTSKTPLPTPQVAHPKLLMFASGGPDNIKQWKCPEGKFIQNLSGHNAIVNCLAANADGVLVSGADNGTMYFWDWKTGYNFQRFQVGVSSDFLGQEHCRSETEVMILFQYLSLQ